MSYSYNIPEQSFEKLFADAVHDPDLAHHLEERLVERLTTVADRELFFKFTKAHPALLDSSPVLQRVLVKVKSLDLARRAEEDETLPDFGGLSLLASRIYHTLFGFSRKNIEPFENQLLQNPEQLKTYLAGREPLSDQEIKLMLSYVEAGLVDPHQIADSLYSSLKEQNQKGLTPLEIPENLHLAELILRKLAISSEKRDHEMFNRILSTPVKSTSDHAGDAESPDQTQTLFSKFEKSNDFWKGTLFSRVLFDDVKTRTSSVANFSSALPLFYYLAKENPDLLLEIFSTIDQFGGSVLSNDARFKAAIPMLRDFGLSDDPKIQAVFYQLLTAKDFQGIASIQSTNGFHHLLPVIAEIAKDHPKRAAQILSINFRENHPLLENPRMFKAAFPLLKSMTATEEGRKCVKTLLCSPIDTNNNTLLHTSYHLAKSQKLIEICGIEIKSLKNNFGAIPEVSLLRL